MNGATFLDRVRASRLAAHEGWFERWRRPAVDIARRENAVTPTRSRIGGSPDLPVGTAWPQHRKGPYRLLMQIDLADMPPRQDWPQPWRGVLTTSGLLSLFVADDPTGELHGGDFDWNDPNFALAHLSPPDATLVTVAPPPAVDVGPTTDIALSATLDIPYTEDQVPEWPFRWDFEDADDRAYSELRSALHGNRYLFGYPTAPTLAYDPTPKGQLPLLSVSSDDAQQWFWHDGDWLMLFVNPASVAHGWFPLAADAG
jgi:hypothetical protein